MYLKFGAVVAFSLVSAVTVRLLGQAPEAIPTTFRHPVTVPAGHLAQACDGGILYRELLTDVPEPEDAAAWERVAIDLSDTLDCTVWTVPGRGDNMMRSVRLANGLIGHARRIQEAGQAREGTAIVMDVWAVGQNLQFGTLVQHIIGVAVQSSAVRALSDVAMGLPPAKRRRLAEPILDLIDRTPTIDLDEERTYLEAGDYGLSALAAPMCQSGHVEAADIMEPALNSFGPERFAHLLALKSDDSIWPFGLARSCRDGVVNATRGALWDQAKIVQQAGTVAVDLVLSDACTPNLERTLSRLPTDPVTGAAMAYQGCKAEPAALPVYVGL